MIGPDHVDALSKVVALIESFRPDIRHWVQVQLNGGSNLGSRPRSNPKFKPRSNPGSNHVRTSGSNLFGEGGKGGEGFELFWQHYPRKQKKQEAVVSYRKINPNQELQALILSAVQQQSRWEQWNKENGRFIPLPSTWLNQQRWTDEPTRLNPDSDDD